jgi:hypothetical protein
MTTATEQAGRFFMRLCLSEDGLGYPDRVGVVATDIGDVAKHVCDSIDEGMPIVVVDADGGETLVTPPSRVQRLLDRIRRRSYVSVQVRECDGRVMHRRRCDRATLARDLLA